MFKKLAKQLKQERVQNSKFPMTMPIESFSEKSKKIFLKSLSRHALNLYERKTDLNNFTKLALSDPENLSHEKLVQDLIDAGEIKDITDEQSYFELSENKRFLEDLGL